MSKVPEEWCAVQLGEVALVRGGTSFPPSLQGRASGDLPFYKVSDMNLLGNEVEMSRSSNWVDEHDLQLLRAKVFPPKTTIFPKVGGALLTNKKRFLSTEALVDNNVMGVVSRDPKQCLPEFLFSWFETVDLSSIANTGPLPSINANQLYELSIPLPESAEQRSIADVLHICRVSINIERAAAAAAVELKQAAMRELFMRGLRGAAQKETEFGPVPDSWREVLLDNCATVQTGAAKGRRFSDAETIDVPYLRVANVQDGHLDLNEMKEIRIRKSEVERYRLLPGDVVLTEGGDFDKLGRGFIWRGELALCVHQNHVFAVRPIRNRLLPEFFAYLAQSSYGKAYFLKVAHKTTNLACINSTKLKAFPVLIPPTLDEQREIVSILDGLDRKISLHRQKRTVLGELFQSLLHKLMTGEIRVSELDLSALSAEVSA